MIEVPALDSGIHDVIGLTVMHLGFEKGKIGPVVRHPQDEFQQKEKEEWRGNEDDGEDLPLSGGEVAAGRCCRTSTHNAGVG